LARRRYQKGALRREGKLWILRWREDVLTQAGTVVRVERRARVGETKDLPTKKLARRVADSMLAHVNEPDYRPGRVVSVEQFAEIYERDVASTFKPSAAKAVRSISRSYIIPTVGKYRLDEVTGQVPQLDQRHAATGSVSQNHQECCSATQRHAESGTGLGLYGIQTRLGDDISAG
jgi:hypothetical protein